MGLSLSASLTALLETHPKAADALLPLLAEARPDDPVEVYPETARRMVHPYAWLLEHVGRDGIRLTESGYLPPSSVSAAAAEFDLPSAWSRTTTREDLALPILALRETAQRMGLLRRRLGALRRSVPASEALADPVALWRLIARNMPVRSRKEHQNQAGMLLVLAVAADSMSMYRDVVAGLVALGWSVRGKPSVTTEMAADLCLDTADVLRWTGAIHGNDLLGTLRPTPEGVLLARAALVSP